VQKLAKEHGWDAVEFALSGGEDFCLLVAVDPKVYTLLATEFAKEFTHPLWAIARATKSNQKIVYLDNKKPKAITKRGYEHFLKGGLDRSK